MGVNVKILCESLLIAEGLKCLLDKSDKVEVLKIASSLEDLIKGENVSCDVLVIGANCVRNVFDGQAKIGTARVLIINDKANDPFPCEDLKSKVSAGLSGIITADANHVLFEKAITKVHAGELWIDNLTLSKSLRKKPSPQNNVNLTKKEAEVLEHLCSGDTNKKIAQKLCISEQTVKSHCNHLFKKFGVENRVKLVILASRMSSAINPPITSSFNASFMEKTLQ